MYKLKQLPEDFVVEENLSPDISSGPYYYFELKKKNLTTNQAVSIISKRLNIRRKNVSYAGNKDKKAVTRQTISIISSRNLSSFSISEENLSLKHLGRGLKPISLGDLNSNNFKITIRNIHKLPEIQEYFPNYFDEQRFSSNNADIGKALIKKDFRKAASLLKENKHPGFDKKLQDNPSNPIGAINAIPKRILMIYLHSYQSLLFNKLLNNHIKENYKHKTKSFSFGDLSFTRDHDEKEFPLIGFDTALDQNTRSILEQEKLSPRDFIIRQLPNLSMEGTKRKAFVQAKNVRVSELKDDELNKGRKKCVLSFTLGPGSYATMFIKTIFS